jgi:hypothetical protein
MEATDFPKSALSRIHRSRGPSAVSAVKDIVVDVVGVVVIEEAKDGLLQTLSDLTSTPSLEL